MNWSLCRTSHKYIPFSDELSFELSFYKSTPMRLATQHYRAVLQTALIEQAFLETQRHVMDVEADTLMQAVIGSTKQTELNAMLTALMYNDSVQSADLPPALEHYFDPENILPPWFDAARAAVGQKVFTTYGLEICIVLLCKSLPECYVCWRGAHVLYETKRLDAPAAVRRNDKGKQIPLPPRLIKRVMETLQFVLNVLAEGGFDPQGKGIVTARKIRLIHASIRVYAKQKGWDTAQYGAPINQEDMAVTLTTFSSSIVDGLKRIGITLSEEEIDGYMHCWEVIGHIMGLHDSLIASDYHDSVVLQEAILKHQAGSTKENAELAQTCIDFIEYIMPPPFKWMFTGITPLIVKYFLDDTKVGGRTLSSILQIQSPKGFWNMAKYILVLCLFKLLTWIQQEGVLIQWLVSKLGRKFIQGLVLAHNDYKQVDFDVPLSLSDKVAEKPSRFRTFFRRNKK